MDIIRDDILVLLNELIVICREAANCHLTAVQAMDEGALASALEKLADARIKLADELAEEVKRKGDIPDTPSDEKLLLSSAATRLKTLIGGDETLQILETCRSQEDRAAETIASLCELDIDDRLRRRLSAAQKEASSLLEPLVEAIASLKVDR